MSWLNKKDIMSLAIEMVEQPSISGTKQEVDMAKKLVEIIYRIKYFQKNNQYVYSEPLVNDRLGRNFVAALLKGSGGKSNKTVILMGHMDVVDILDYGELKNLAFNPEKLTRALVNYPLPQDARMDLESGNYLFGRGIADMKSGQAVQIALMQHFSENPGLLNGNILFLSVPDEETSSRGALACVPFLNMLKAKERLDYQAAVNCEPTFPDYPGDNSNYIYTGSMGKSVVMFYCYGKETHVGDALSGLNGNLLSSEITRLLEGNTQFCDKLEEVVSPPPTCLKQKDYKRLYSAQIPHNAVSYFNIPIIVSDPRDIMIRLKKLAEQAFINVLKNIENKRREFFNMKNLPYKPAGWQPQIYSYKEFYELVYNEAGGIVEEKIKSLHEKHKSRLEQQELSIMIVDELQKISSDKSPKIIIGYIPPYYPSIIINNSDAREEKLAKITDNVIIEGKGKYNTELVKCRSFTGISDLSYFQIKNYNEVENYLKPNMPNWNLDYTLPIEDIKELNVPGINIGVYGKDAHKYHERIEITYSYEVMPRLLEYAVKQILD